MIQILLEKRTSYEVVDLSISIQAAKLCHQLKLPMADSLIYATALQNDAVLWTQDNDFKNLKYVKYIKK